MSNNNGSENKLPLQCPVCGQRWSITPSVPEIANNIYSSVVTLAHERLIHCANSLCPAIFVLKIAGVQLALQAAGVDPERAAEIEGSRIIVPDLKLVN